LNKNIVIKAENISKQYRLGQVGTGTISHDLNRFWHKIRGKEDPYLKIGETNDRSTKGDSDYVWSLRDINFEIEQGDAVGIIGRNGAGKSTLLKLLSRVTKPTTGNIYTKGRIASLLEVGTGFHPEMTGRENIYLNGAILGMTRKEITRKFDEIVDFSGVERYVDTPVKRYSSGMYVRLAFAVAAHLESEILIVDEVLAVGDAEFQKKCLGKMGDVSKGEGRTVLFVSHNMGAIRNLCDNTIFLENGQVKYIGNVEDGINNYYHNNIVDNSNSIEMGIYDLENHFMKKDKKNGILKVEMYSNGNLSDTIITGSDVKFIIHYNTNRDYFEPEIGIHFKDLENTNYFCINNKHVGIDLKIKKGFGKAVIEIKDFPIYANADYYVNLYFGDMGPNYEVLENALKVKILGEDYYGSGRSLLYSENKLVIKEINFKTF
jgi:lipopolysaccharide transport system ATP-binding protein